MRVPTMSLGSRSGVNCTRLNLPPTAAASARHASVFATPGMPFEQDVPVGEQRHHERIDDLGLSDDRVRERVADGLRSAHATVSRSWR